MLAYKSVHPHIMDKDPLRRINTICCIDIAGICDELLRNKAQETSQNREYQELYKSQPVIFITAALMKCSATSCTIYRYPMVVYTTQVKNGHNYRCRAASSARVYTAITKRGQSVLMIKK